jgi:rare lipoprotein A
VRARSAIGRIILGIAAAVLVLPVGAAAGGTGGASAPTGPTAPAVGSGPAASAGALAVTPASLVRGQTALVTGTLPSAPGRTVWLQVRTASRGWATVASATSGTGGAFAIAWPTSRAGRLTVRVAGQALATPAAVRGPSPLSATPPQQLLVYVPVVATWYGPGFYGHHTACGETLTTHIVGLADRTLPCGTPVAVTYNGRTLTIPVIDRGPYSGPAALDLTHAAAEELGMTETENVGMLALKGPALAPANWFAPGTSSGSTGASGPTANVGGATAPTS